MTIIQFPKSLLSLSNTTQACYVNIYQNCNCFSKAVVCKQMAKCEWQKRKTRWCFKNESALMWMWLCLLSHLYTSACVNCCFWGGWGWFSCRSWLWVCIKERELRGLGAGGLSPCVCPEWLCNCRAAGRGPLLWGDESSTASILTPVIPPLVLSLSLCRLSPSISLLRSFSSLSPLSYTQKNMHVCLANSQMSGPAGGGGGTHTGLLLVRLVC